MRKLKLYIAPSLDGKIARPDGGIDWLPDPNGAEDYGYQEFYNSIDATLMGYKTYELSVSFGEWPYPGKKSYVFTRDAAKTTVAEAEIVTKEPIDFVKELKQQEGMDIWLIGGGEIVSLLHDAGLIDEYIIAYIPVLLGAGVELFPGIKQQVNLRLNRYKIFENGVAMFYFEK